MQKVFVLDTNKQLLQPCHPARARQLLNSGKAAVYRRYPFTLLLKREVTNPDSQTLRLKIDPGSKTTGLAILNDKTGEIIWAAELQHRGQQIKKSLDSRRAIRKSRRNLCLVLTPTRIFLSKQDDNLCLDFYKRIRFGCKNQDDNLKTPNSTIQGISHRYCHLLQREFTNDEASYG